jgi:hypothetical protein
MPTYARSNDGLIHLVNEIQAEFTLCGDAFDGDSEDPDLGWNPWPKGPVTCPHCAAIIRSCQRVHTKLEK